MDLIELSHIAIEAARSAGLVIQRYMDVDVVIEAKQGGASYASQIITDVDRASESAIFTRLLPTCDAYNMALLSEESEDDGSRLEKDFFWCVDPMDGTLPFIQKRPGFAVSIALVANDGTPYIGVVYDPCTDTMYHAIKGIGAYKNGVLWEISCRNDYLTYVTDRKLKDTLNAIKIEKLLHEYLEKFSLSGIKELSGAGAVMNAILVLEHRPACMLKLPKKELGGGSIWDFAATACIYNELGLPATNYKGERLDLNRKDGTFMNHQGVYYASVMMDN